MITSVFKGEIVKIVKKKKMKDMLKVMLMWEDKVTQSGTSLAYLHVDIAALS